MHNTKGDVVLMNTSKRNISMILCSIQIKISSPFLSLIMLLNLGNISASCSSTKVLINTSYAMLSSGIPWNMPRVTCIFRIHTSLFEPSVFAKKIQVTSGMFHGIQRESIA